jgi:hypothetical protein
MFFQNYNRLLGLRERYNSRSFSASEFTKIIRRQFPAADFSFQTHRDYAVDPDMIVVAGIYDCYNDAQFLPHTEITLCYHPEQDIYIGNNLDWQQISFDIAECIGHELIHRQQYKSKAKFKPYKGINSEQEYLGDESEIDAYGFSIAAESVVYNRPYTECTMFKVYQTTFDNDHSVVVKLQKQIVKYLKEQELNYEQVDSNSGRRV